MSMEEVQAQLHKDCFGPKKHPLHFSEARRLKMISQVRYSAVWAIAWGGVESLLPAPGLSTQEFSHGHFDLGRLCAG
jgi:hypothetical protein